MLILATAKLTHSTFNSGIRDVEGTADWTVDMHAFLYIVRKAPALLDMFTRALACLCVN